MKNNILRITIGIAICILGIGISYLIFNKSDNKELETENFNDQNQENSSNIQQEENDNSSSEEDNSNEEKQENASTNSSQETSNQNIDKALLEKIVGDYGICPGMVCYGFIIDKDSNNYYYRFYQPNSGGYRNAQITKVKKISNNKYQLTGYYPATTSESINGERPAKTSEITIDISKISSNILILKTDEIFTESDFLTETFEYEKITTSRDEFYSSKKKSETEKFEKVLGDWGRCDERFCYGIQIWEEIESIYNYIFYVAFTDGLRTARVLYNPPRIDDNKYKITGYYSATTADSGLGELPETTEELIIDVSKISSNIIIVNNKEYKRITTSRDEFYNQ